MLNYFLRENPKLNKTLNLIENGKFADARYLWMNHLANNPSVDGTWLCHITSSNGELSWDCWSDEFVHFCTLRMMQFVELEDIGKCNTCGSKRASSKQDSRSLSPLHNYSENTSTSDHDFEAILEQMTILVYHRNEDAKKLLQSLKRDLEEEEINIVNTTLYPTKSAMEGSKAVTDGKDSISYQGMCTLCPGTWLNDEIVAFFHKVCLNKLDVVLCERHSGRKRSFAFSSYFMGNLFGEKLSDPDKRGIYNFANVSRWSKKAPGGNLFNLRYLLFPINVKNTHWTLAVVSMEDKCIRYYDSMRNLTSREQVQSEMTGGILKYLKDEYEAVNDGNDLDVGRWSIVDCTRETPQQTNGESIVEMYH